jgi:hypothetical protein
LLDCSNQLGTRWEEMPYYLRPPCGLAKQGLAQNKGKLTMSREFRFATHPTRDLTDSKSALNVVIRQTMSMIKSKERGFASICRIAQRMIFSVCLAYKSRKPELTLLCRSGLDSNEPYMGSKCLECPLFHKNKDLLSEATNGRPNRKTEKKHNRKSAKAIPDIVGKQGRRIQLCSF